MPFFADIGKSVSDLFKKKDYQLKRTVKVTIPDNDVTVATKTVQGTGGVQTEVKYTQNGITKKFGGNLSVTADTTDNYTIEFKKLKLGNKIKADTKIDTAKNAFNTKFKYSDSSYNAQLNADYNYDKNDLNAVASFVLGYEGISVGAQASARRTESDFGDIDYNVGVEWDQGESNYSLKTSNRVGRVTLAAQKKYGKDSTVAVQLTHDIDNGNSNAAVGGGFQLDDKSNVQGFLESSGNIYALYKYGLSDRVTASIGAQTNLNDLEGFQNVGYKLEFQ